MSQALGTNGLAAGARPDAVVELGEKLLGRRPGVGKVLEDPEEPLQPLHVGPPVPGQVDEARHDLEEGVGVLV